MSKATHQQANGIDYWRYRHWDGKRQRNVSLGRRDQLSREDADNLASIAELALLTGGDPRKAVDAARQELERPQQRNALATELLAACEQLERDAQRMAQAARALKRHLSHGDAQL